MDIYVRINAEGRNIALPYLEIKVDCLELGRIAAAKYGRNTGVNWDDIISKSKIVVNTSVHITSNQRGEY